MLSKLSVRNYALIRELDLSLEDGLTIITGETGAGKSILLGALSLILGSRADSSVLLDTTDKCIVEGTFKIDGYDLEDFFTKNDLDYGPAALMRREINPAGKSRAFINDTPVNLNLMKELGEKLIDIHSQHQTLMLNENAFQLSVIDSFAGNAGLRNNYSKSYHEYRKLQKEYEDLKAGAERNKADLEYYQFQLNQLLEAKLEEGEQEELEREQELLLHAEEIKLALESATQLLSYQETSVLSMLRQVKAGMSRISGYLPEAKTLLERISSSCIELDDLSGEIGRLSQNVEANPGRLSKINDRLDLLYSLIQKHRLKDLQELIEKREEIRTKISSIALGDEKLAAMENTLKTNKEMLGSLAAEFSGKRKAVLPVIETKITGLLNQLGMPNARFRITLSATGDFTSSGIDSADFLFSANRQTEPENIARIASGGELSRVMLSLKSVISKNNNLPTIIFDEIDSGVSGEVADKVGQILSGMGSYMQVVNITHLPQVASRGTRHYHVYKEDSVDSTITRIRLLSNDERIMEVARLLSGSKITETAMKNARELIKAARN